MRFRSKLFLLLAVTLWGISYTPVDSLLYGIPKPLGAVFFGLFLITWIVPPRDFRQFEHDQALREQLIRNEQALKKRRRARPRVRWKPREAYS